MWGSRGERTRTKRCFVREDLGDKGSRFCALDRSGAVIARGPLDTARGSFAALLPHPCRVAIEVGTHSPWVSRELEAAGHEVHVANPRKVRLIFAGGRKNDRLDAENLPKAFLRVSATPR